MNGFESDARAAALAGRLASADFSVESSIRLSLRARLLGYAAPRETTPVRVWVGWALAALALWIPIRSALRRVPPWFPVGASGLPVLPGRIGERPGAKSEPVFETYGAQEVFERKAVDGVFERSRAESMTRDGASLIVWKLDGASYALERRRTSLEEIFVKVVL